MVPFWDEPGSAIRFTVRRLTSSIRVTDALYTPLATRSPMSQIEPKPSDTWQAH
jgi:hypothetical protein